MSTGVFSTDAKERVRQATDIVELVSHYVQLRREGRAYKALCPWHDDSRPSLQVNPERQSFRCWVCDIGGDVFSFLMKMESVTFPEAMSMLAERAGITLDTRAGGGEAADIKRTLYQAMAWAEERYHQCLLHAPEAEVARKYLRERGISDESVKKFRLGYAPEGWSWILDEARQTRFTPQVLEQVGLVGRSERGKPYDRFRRRVLFSIRDPQSRPVALGGRVLPGGDENQQGAKYVNSPETPLFSKSGMLYALDAAKDTLAKSRTAVVMEGYTDCIVAHQCGFTGSLAVLGTALGERHIKLLRRYVDRIILVLDGDEAGRRRADQILELFIAENLDLRILTLPDNLDPCDFLQARGKESFNALLEGAVDALEHRFRTATCDLDQSSGMFAVTKAVEDVLGTLARSPGLSASSGGSARIKEGQMLNRLARRFGVDEPRLRQRLQELRGAPRRQPPAAAPPPVAEQRTRMVKAERALLEILLHFPQLWREVDGQIDAEEFSCPRRRQIFATFRSLAADGHSPSFEQLLSACDEPAVQSSLVDLDNEGQAIGRTDPLAELRELVHVFRHDRSERAARQQSARAAIDRASPAEDDELEAFRKLVQEKRHRQGISPPMDG